MKQIFVISPVYKNIQVNFDGFIVKFNVEGKGVLNFEEKDTDKIENILKIHSNIYEGTELPKEEKIEQKKEEVVNSKDNNKEIDLLKDSNKKLALENVELKKENAELKKKNEELALENVELKKENAELIDKHDLNNNAETSSEKENKENDNVEETSEDKNNDDNKEEKDKNEEEEIKEQLNSKTVAQLKDLLNSEDFIGFKEEWKGLTKKEDIVNYICKKIKEEGSK